MAAPKRVATDERTGTRYDKDPFAWAIEQAQHPRAGAWTKRDIANLADEIEDVAGSERRRLTSRLRIILLHLLRWDHQPDLRSRSWASPIRSQRPAAEDRLEDCPSLGLQVNDLIARAYRRARIEAAGETGLDESICPETCPYGFDAIMNRPVAWPATA